MCRNCNQHVPKTVEPDYEMVSQLMAYETGELDDSATVSLFQRLIDDGVIWQLSSDYTRTAAALIEGGQCYNSLAA